MRFLLAIIALVLFLESPAWACTVDVDKGIVEYDTASTDLEKLECSYAGTMQLEIETSVSGTAAKVEPGTYLLYREIP